MFCKQTTAYEMRISDWSSDVCSSDLDGTADLANLRLARATDRFTLAGTGGAETFEPHFTYHGFRYVEVTGYPGTPSADDIEAVVVHSACREVGGMDFPDAPLLQASWQNALWSQRSNFVTVPTDCPQRDRSEEQTSELQSLMRISYAVFCLQTQK